VTDHSLVPDSDCAYRPFDSGIDWVKALSPQTVMLLGRESDEIAARIATVGTTDARVSHADRRLTRLHDGIYAFIRNGEWHSVWVNGGKAETSPSEGRLTYNQNHVGEAVYTYEDEWDLAHALLGDSPVRKGAIVAIPGRAGWGRVNHVRRLADGHTVDVDISGVVENFDVNDVIILEGDIRDPAFWVAQGPAEAVDIARTLSWIKLAYPLSDTLYSYAATKTIFKPYQFVPVLKMLNSSSGRLLIADEVGLGKTIEAGLIWTELEQRGPINRALVVVPASLQVKWRQEMDRRFMRPLPELTTEVLTEFLNDMRDGKDATLIGVVSLERLRSSRGLIEQFAELAPQLDLVIFDEAHAMRNVGRRSHDVGLVLGELADHLVFLSATPLNLGTDDLYTLVSLLEPGLYPDKAVFSSQLEPNQHLNRVMSIMADPLNRSNSDALLELAAVKTTRQGQALSKRPSFAKLEQILRDETVPSTDTIARIKRYASDLNTLGSIITRTRKIDVPGKKALREVEEVRVAWSPQERDLYQAIHEHILRRASNSNVPLGFATQMPLRQACSSLIVAQRRQADRNGWELTGSDEMASEETVRTELGDESVIHSDVDIDDDLVEVLLRTRLDHDSKLQALSARLALARANGMPQALIFSFFRGTVEYLADELDKDVRTAVLHGGIPMQDRQSILDQFRAGEIDVLIANQVGSEGLDFEFCNVLVNYDLPWNPMQVEQRIGRLDRFGQKNDKIHIFNMFTPDTIESDIFGRLYARIGVFERSIGDLEPIMRGGFSDLNKTILDPKLSNDQKIRAVDQFDVAVAQERDRARALEEQSGMLTSLALLDVEGLSEAGPTNGRYVGSAELRSLLHTALEAKGGSLKPTSSAAIWTIYGSPALSTALDAHRKNKTGTMLGVAKLIGLIREGTPIVVTFDPDHPNISNTELITARHPLVRFAVELLSEKKDDLARYGRVGLPGLGIDESYIATIDIVRTTGGLNEKQELWFTAVDTRTGAISNSLSDRFMTALAEGKLLPTTRLSAVPNVLNRLEDLQSLVSSRRTAERSEQIQENQARISARVVSEEKSIDIKIGQAQARLRTAQSNGTASSIDGMSKARIRNLEALKKEVADKYAPKQNIAMSIEHVAVLLVSSPSE
jgi:superfamily II DNA or RNA helicase